MLSIQCPATSDGVAWRSYSAFTIHRPQLSLRNLSELVSVVWWCAAGAVPPAGDQHLHHNRKVSAWTRRRCRPITGRRGQAGRRRRAVIGRRVAAAGWAGQAVSQCGAVSWQCFSRTVGSSQWTAPGSHYSPVSAAL